MTIYTKEHIDDIHRRETRREKFMRLANKRIASALDDIRLIENLLQNRYAYDYTPQDVESLTISLGNAVQRIGLYKGLDNH